MPQEIRLLGWEIEFHDVSNDIIYKSEIIDLAISQDVNTCLVKCKIKYLVDSSFIKYFSKPHYGTLIIINKMMYTDDIEEIFSVDLEAITNVGSINVREDDVSQAQTIPISINYYCKKGISLMNKRVGKIYHKMKLEDIVKDLYKQTECDLPLKIEPFDNKTLYNNIFIPEGSFISGIRYLNQQFGFYDSEMVMFGETFVDDETNWIINNVNKVRKDDEPINLYFMSYGKNERKVEPISERKYYTYIPVNINNSFSQIAKKLPKLINYISFDTDKFIKRQDISVSKILKEISFSKSNKQFDKLLQNEKQIVVGPRFDIKDYSIKNSLQMVGLSAYSIPINIPNPFLLEHFKIGTVINFNNEIENNIKSTDISLIVLGWLLRIKQGTHNSGGGSYQASLTVRASATSFLDEEENDE